MLAGATSGRPSAELLVTLDDGSSRKLQMSTRGEVLAAMSPIFRWHV
jgi:hypothetical protein